MKRHCCPTCHWYDEGHCHVNPPSVQILMSQGLAGGPQPQPISFHPPVRPTEFCCRHSAIKDGIIIDGEVH